MFSKILIANRGEIACRIIQTAKRLGIKTVAVFSEIDANARHVTLADEAVELQAPTPQRSYLDGTQILNIATATNAEAIHPGYGFLSENADFAADCKKANIVFIGPKPETIANMGNKDQAKLIMQNAGVPTTPGYLGEDQSCAAFIKAAKKIGYPILLKAAAGGGGKGMRLVQSPDDLEQAINSARRESETAFGDGTLFLEKYLENARHVEIQVFADTHGNKVHLFDRDCSIQRRHQKIIEEAPAPHLSEKIRSDMQETAITILNAVEYLGAGTIEFLVDKNHDFYFMEMNTRLQVEHPVTEKITDQDLVEWQIRVAAGEPLPLKQSQIKAKGHAIEARICAENPYEQFTPSIGPLLHLDFPEPNEHIRVDTGVQQEDEISLYYDSMIAKIITYADSREDALLQLKSALSETHIVGVNTNTDFLFRICAEKDFINGNISTNFIPEHKALLSPVNSIAPELIALTSFYYSQQLQTQGHQLAQTSEDLNSPWFIRDQWRMNARPVLSFNLWHQGEAIFIQITNNQIGFNKKIYRVSLIWEDNFQLSVSVNDRSINAAVVPFGNVLHIFYNGGHYQLHTTNPRTMDANPFETETQLGSPMPGNIIEITVTPDQHVKKGEKLITLEAMKMEHQILAPADGVIKAVHCDIGDSVLEGANLIEFEKA